MRHLHFILHSLGDKNQNFDRNKNECFFALIYRWGCNIVKTSQKRWENNHWAVLVCHVFKAIIFQSD